MNHVAGRFGIKFLILSRDHLDLLPKLKSRKSEQCRRRTLLLTSLFCPNLSLEFLQVLRSSTVLLEHCVRRLTLASGLAIEVVAL